MIQKIDGCANNPENSSVTKISEHIPCGYSMATIWDFDNIENKYILYRWEDYMKKFCTSLREYATNVINFEKKKVLPLTKKELKLHQDAAACYICVKRFLKKFSNNKNYWKVRDHCRFTGKNRSLAHSICNLRFNVPDKTLVDFQNRSNYDYDFIIKELENEFKGQFECLGKSTENCNTFSIPIEKEVTKIDRDGNESVVTISYKIKLIDSARFIIKSCR